MVGWEEGSVVRIAHEAEEIFPAAGDDEAEELGVWGGDLTLMYDSLLNT